MIILDYKKSQHKNIINACVEALRLGKVVAYPTDTTYGLAVDASNLKALKKLYKIKGRAFNKAVSVIVPSKAFAKKNVIWSRAANKLANKFWPGALTLVLRVGAGTARLKQGGQWPPLHHTASPDRFAALRMPANKIALDLSRLLKKPITATSANVSGLPDCYSAQEIVSQYAKQNIKPDLIINAGKLPKTKPSTLVKISNQKVEILRHGPVGEKQIISLIGY